MKLLLFGKRLWPLSNDSRSKQFIKILKNDSNDLQSMVHWCRSYLPLGNSLDRDFRTNGYSKWNDLFY